MTIEICTVSGYNEVGRNMTAVRVDDEVVIFDMGIHLENYIRFTQDDELISIAPDDLISVGAVPDISKIKDWKNLVKAIVVTHAHLDHVGAIPYLSNEFRAPIICTPFTKAVLSSIIQDQDIRLKNPVKALHPNSKYKISNKLELEFVHMTHSTPQTIMIALHTPYGIVAYVNDFKFDLFPTLGQKSDFHKLKKLGEKGVKVLIVESIYAALEQKMPSESIARQLLMEVLLGVDSSKNAIFVTTFSSHLARLKSIIEFGRQINRKVVFMGRSLNKYVHAGESIGLVSFSKKAEIIKFQDQVRKKLKKISQEGREKYLVVVTGHMGEPKSLLVKIANRQYPFEFKKNDIVVFSNRVIPSSTNIANREALETLLKSRGVRIFKDIHVSGHAAKEDLRDLITYLKPKHIIPAHGDVDFRGNLARLAHEVGYESEKTVHLMDDGERIIIV